LIKKPKSFVDDLYVIIFAGLRLTHAHDVSNHGKQKSRMKRVKTVTT